MSAKIIRNPNSFLGMLESAVAGKNKQAHRVAGGTKRGRQLIARSSNKDIVGNKGESRELRDAQFSGPNSTSDIRKDS